MKKTNVAILNSASRFLKILPLLLGLALLCSSDLAAQNYKSPSDAATAVKEAVEPLQASIPQNSYTKQMTPTQTQNYYNYVVLTEFLEQLGESSSVAEAVERLDGITKIGIKDRGNNNYMLDARDYLMDLITD